jgi:hypothetical protein
MLSCFNPALPHPLLTVDRHEAGAVSFGSAPGKCMLRCLYCIFVVLTCHESAVSFDHIVFWIVAPDWWPGHETIDRIRWFLIIITTTLDLQ